MDSVEIDHDLNLAGTVNKKLIEHILGFVERAAVGDQRSEVNAFLHCLENVTGRMVNNGVHSALFEDELVNIKGGIRSFIEGQSYENALVCEALEAVIKNSGIAGALDDAVNTVTFGLTLNELNKVFFLGIADSICTKLLSDFEFVRSTAGNENLLCTLPLCKSSSGKTDSTYAGNENIRLAGDDIALINAVHTDGYDALRHMPTRTAGTF